LIAVDLEESIMDCWKVVDDIKFIYQESCDGKEVMSEDELAGLLIGIECMYKRKFERLWNTFERACEHGGIWLDADLVDTARQHREYGDKLDDMLDGDEKFGDFKDENPNAQSNTQRET